MNRRTFIQSGTAASLGLGITACSNAPETAQAQAPTPANSGLHPALAALKPMTAGVQPITRMNIVRQNQKGGFYVAPLELNVKLLFTPVGHPNTRPLVLKQNVRFNHNPRMPWVMGRPWDSESLRATVV